MPAPQLWKRRSLLRLCGCLVLVLLNVSVTSVLGYSSSDKVVGVDATAAAATTIALECQAGSFGEEGCSADDTTDEGRFSGDGSISNEEVVTAEEDAQVRDNETEDDNYEDDEEYDDEEDEEEEEYGPGERFGVLQSLEHPEADSALLLQTLEATEQYLESFAVSVDAFVYLRGECSNQDELCTLWAAQGSCETNQSMMHESCLAACQACNAPTGPGSEWGVAQELHYVEGGGFGESHNAQLQRKLNETEQYVKETIWKDEFYAKVVNLCFDYESLCTQWAVVGECDMNPGYMHRNCPASCETCHQLHYETRCPLDPEIFPDIWKPGDLNAMFEHLVADNDYETTVLSRPNFLEGEDETNAEYEIGPWIVAVDNFFTEEEATHLIEWAGDMGFHRSEEVGGVDKDTGEAKESLVSEDRTSTNAWCNGECDYDHKVVEIFDRIEKMTGIPPDHSESLQLLKYEPDQFYLTHSDFIPHSNDNLGGPRILTVFLYLSNVEEGGETRFDWFDGDDGEGLFVTPKLGRVVVWPNVRNDAPHVKEHRTMHEAMPVIKGQKFAANAWLHLRDLGRAEEMGC